MPAGGGGGGQGTLLPGHLVEQLGQPAPGRQQGEAARPPHHQTGEFAEEVPGIVE